MTLFGLEWWIPFNLVLILLLVLDVRYLRRSTDKPRPSQSLLLTAAWVSLAMLFALLIFMTKGQEPALKFITGYLIEESLSVDNLFVFLMIFQYFHVPESQTRRILMYGILGALIMRFVFIFVGISLIHRIPWILYVFGAFLVVTGILMFKKPEKSFTPRTAFLVTWLKKFIPITDHWEDGQFFVRKSGRLFATPAFVVLLTVEATDLFFALDSIPAVFAITLDPFIVYSCNAMAILGLRSLFFVLKDLLEFFEYLHYGVSLILIFVGSKMLLRPVYEIPTVTSLCVIGSILFLSMLLSAVRKKVPK